MKTLITLLLLAIATTAAAQLEPDVIEKSGYPKVECSPDLKLWECRPCPPPNAEQSGKRCMCRYCVNPRLGKTVDKDKDLQQIYCFKGNPTS